MGVAAPRGFAILLAMYSMVAKVQGAMAEKTEWDRFEKTQQINLRVPAEFFKAIDDWRRWQPDLPGRSEAIRRLVELGLKVERRPRK
jgi:hypothetical protein